MSVVSDIIEIGRNMFARAAGGARPVRPRPATQRPLLPLADIRSKYYLRFGVVDQPGVLGQLMTVLGAHAVSIEQVVQDTKSSDPVAVVVLTHEAREGDIRRALAEIEGLAVVKTAPRVIRIAA
jgi:homoserine dehydrogenase